MEILQLKKFFIAIEIILVIVTYGISNNLYATSIAALIVAVSHMSDDDNPFMKAGSVFAIACLSSLIYLFGTYAGRLADSITIQELSGLKSCLEYIDRTLISGATPPFNITSDPASDIAIFVFGFAFIEILLAIIVQLRKFK